MHYTVDPGLYAVGTPGPHSPVLVTANYKMSFDCVRSVLTGRSAWILVLDTQGINVWCAAGKGTFGTQELVERIRVSGLAEATQQRTLILPQLAAPGVAAHTVKRQSGFRVVYGPIRAEDIPAFMDSGLKATPEMRQKTFTIGERAVLIPVELVGALKTGLYRRSSAVPLGWSGRSGLVLGQRGALRSLCRARRDRGHRGRHDFHANTAAVVAWQGFFRQRPASGSGGSGISRSRQKRWLEQFLRGPGNCRVVPRNVGDRQLLGHELYRSFHVYVVVRRAQRNALRSSLPDCRGSCRPGNVALLQNCSMRRPPWPVRLFI